ncbi:metalloreductase steap2 [Plakobranchus ocellatus]|uniref:Metalloreductase steap2 n=1 Tax=Plakobranchus ocellatus TaxID=259542 RepID=A0AAV3X8W0_9GAST|nr:metalloreductase steap2 [Plakobranchus ocellatus]
MGRCVLFRFTIVPADLGTDLTLCPVPLHDCPCRSWDGSDAVSCQLASILQIYYGTKHRRFPQFLDTWLKSRKQFGLVSFFLVTVHAIASAMMLSPTYYSSWFHKVTVTLPANLNLTSATSDLVLTPSKAWMIWKGEAACALGVLAFVLMAVVALTSIRSVGETLNWSEWRCVHSQVSYGVLALSAAHVCVMGSPGWVKKGFPETFKSITFLSVLLPLFVLLLKLVFSLPPLRGYLLKIRRGWERSNAAIESGNKNLSQARGGCCGSKNSAGVNIIITDEMDSGKGASNFIKPGTLNSCCGSEKQGKLAVAASSSSSSSEMSTCSSSTSRSKTEGKEQSAINSSKPGSNSNRNDYSLFGGISLHKDCKCTEQSAPPSSILQCQCSSV